MDEELKMVYVDVKKAQEEYLAEQIKMKKKRKALKEKREEELKMSLESFKEEINAICNKYNFDIGGCGCCGSPFITYVDKEFGVLYLEDNFNTREGDN